MTRTSSIYSNPYYLRENYREYTPEAYRSQVVGITKTKKKKAKTTSLTPAQASQRSKKKQALKEQKHLLCPMELRPRGPHTGLYCSCHGTWIRWISQTEAAKIQDILSIS
jgi:hypothetical protein